MRFCERDQVIHVHECRISQGTAAIGVVPPARGHAAAACIPLDRCQALGHEDLVTGVQTVTVCIGPMIVERPLERDRHRVEHLGLP